MEYTKQHPTSIQALFGSIAHRYDFTNAILSCQLHSFWNRSLVRAMQEKKVTSPLLDLCCGTGEIAFTYLRKHLGPHQHHVYLLDFCEEMLDTAKQKASHLPALQQHKLEYLQADAQEIPLSSSSVGAVTLAYGIRNVQDPMRCLREVYRVLKPGGYLGILELTEPKNPILRSGHRLYTRICMPLLGKLFTSNKQAYQYLCQSIREFTKPELLREMMHQCGFSLTEVRPLTGGIATLLLGQKSE